MPILFALLLIFVGIPALEIYLFVVVGQRIGVWPTIGLTVAAMFLGAFLIRYQGMLTLVRVRDAFMRGEPPAMALLEGLAMLISGVLLLLPGFFTDAIGVLLLLPFLRRFLIRSALGRRNFRPHARPDSEKQGPVTLDGEYRRDDEPRLR